MLFKTLIITVWFGEWPEYLTYFLKSLSSVAGINWLLISDNSNIPSHPDNLQFQTLSLAEFNDLAGRKLEIPLKIYSPKKLCDLKPSYGKIFNEKLTNYHYWGYCDIDMVFGNIGFFLEPLLGKYDVISCYRGFLSGPFCLYRNSIPLTELYMKNPGYKSILQNQDHLAFDENIRRNPSVMERLIRIRYPLRYLFNLPYASLFNLPELRYQYQWFVKRHESNRRIPGDMTDIVFRQVKKKQIAAYFSEMLHSDRSFIRRGRKSWELQWNHGTLKDTSNNREIFAFHFVESKFRDDFHISSSQPVPDSFTLTEKGIQP